MIFSEKNTDKNYKFAAKKLKELKALKVLKERMTTDIPFNQFLHAHQTFATENNKGVSMKLPQLTGHQSNATWVRESGTD